MLSKTIYKYTPRGQNCAIPKKMPYKGPYFFSRSLKLHTNIENPHLIFKTTTTTTTFKNHIKKNTPHTRKWQKQMASL